MSCRRRERVADALDAGEFSSSNFVDYASERVDSRGPAAEFRACYRPTGPTFHARAGTLDHFLTARFCLYATDARVEARGDARSRLFRCEIDHAPWPLQRAEATIERNTMLAAHGLPTPTSLPILHFARQLDVAAWMLAPIGFVESKTSVCSTTADV